MIDRILYIIHARARGGRGDIFVGVFASWVGVFFTFLVQKCGIAPGKDSPIGG